MVALVRIMYTYEVRLMTFRITAASLLPAPFRKRCMSFLYAALTLFLLLNLSVSLWRVIRGPSYADSMLTAQLFGTTAVAVLALFAQATQLDALRDVALVFALLSAVTAVAFVRRAWAKMEQTDDR